MGGATNAGTAADLEKQVCATSASMARLPVPQGFVPHVRCAMIGHGQLVEGLYWESLQGLKPLKKN